MKKNLIDKGFGNELKIPIIRKTDIDQILLFQRSKSVSRRRTLAKIEAIRPILKQPNHVDRRKSADALLMQRSRSSPTLMLPDTVGKSTPGPLPSTSTPTQQNREKTQSMVENPVVSPIPNAPSPVTSTSASTSNTSARECPQLIRLNSLLKQPKKAAFNVRRKSVEDRNTEKTTTTNIRATSSAPTTPTLPKRTATKIIMARLSDHDRNESKSLIASPLFADAADFEFGRLHYSTSSESD